MEMRFVIIIAIAFVLIMPLSAFGETYANSECGFTIFNPDGWKIKEFDGCSENIVSFAHSQGNAFLYVALDESPLISTSKSGNSYLNELEVYWKNSSGLSNVEIINSKISSWDGNNAYVISFFYGSSDNLTKRIIIEIPENGKTWRISNDFNIKNSNGEIPVDMLLNSFKKISITEPKKAPTSLTVNHSKKFDDYVNKQLNNPENIKNGFATALIYSDDSWQVIVTRNYEIQPEIRKDTGIKLLPFGCSTKIAVGDLKSIPMTLGEYEVRLQPKSSNSGLAVIKDGYLLGKKFGGSLAIHGSCDDAGSNIKTNVGGGCLIATATYGSELAPQVQQLRELRDNSLLQTESGTSFMNLFNDVYYSFSPVIADYERENPVFREMVKVAITPMVSSLSILNYVDMDSEESVLGYGISIILLNAMMYVGIPILAVIKIRK